MEKGMLFKRFMAVVLCLGILAGNVPYGALPALAEDTTTGITETVEPRQADPLSNPNATAVTITTVDAPAALTAPVGTQQADLGLPAALTGHCENGSTVEIPVTWSCENYAADTAGAYTFTAAATAPEGFALAEGLALPTQTVTLQQADESDNEPAPEQMLIAAVDAPAALTAPVGTAQEALGLPAALTGHCEDDSTVEVPVTWSCDSYAADTAGEYTFTAAATAPEGFALAEGLTLPTQTVTLQQADESDNEPAPEQTLITAVDAPAAIAAPVGTQQADLGLPAALTGRYDGGTVEVPVTWHCDSYDPDTAGEYTFTAAATAPEGFALAEGLTLPSLTVTLQADNGVMLLNDKVVKAGNLTDTITYTITEKTDPYGMAYHVLTLEGTGEMPYYSDSTYQNAPWFDYQATLREVCVGEGITSIGNCSFYGYVSPTYYYQQLQTVTFPTTLKTIGDDAFYYCESLTTADLSGCTALETIGDYAFYHCESLTTADLSGCTALETIGDYAFYGCESLTTAGLSDHTNLQTIGEVAFYGCESLTTLDLSGCTALKTIGRSAFSSCSALTTLDLSACTALKTIGREVFSGCSALTAVDLTGCTSLETIDEQVFFRCFALTTLDLTGCTALQTIGFWAFRECSALTTLDLSACTALKTIGQGGFSACSALTTVVLTGCTALQTIGKEVFSDCSALTTVDLTGCTSLETIGEEAFADCTKLTTVSFPGALKSMGSGLFTGCMALRRINALISSEEAAEALGSALASGPDSLKPFQDVRVYANDAGEIVLSSSLLQEWRKREVRLAFGNTNARVTFAQGSGTAAATAGVPLNTLSGPAYIDAQGAVYRLDDTGKTASLAYVPKDLTTYTVPESIAVPTADGTAEESYSVTGVSGQALGMAYSLITLTFANPGAVTLADYALANCATLTQVNGVATVADAEALFGNGNVGVNAFLGTGLQAGEDPDRVTGTSIVLKSENEQATMTLEVIEPDPCREEEKVWVTGTGKPITLQLSVGGTDAAKHTYRLYFFSPDNGIDRSGLGMKVEGEEYTFSEATCTLHSVEGIPGLFYVDIKINNAGSTWKWQPYLQYAKGSAGGSLITWIEMDPAEGVVQRAPAGQYHEYRWETEPVPYSLTLASNGGSTFSYTRAEPGAPVSLTIDPSWKMTVTPVTRTTYAGHAELALDPARVMEYTFTLALPEGMIWAEEVRDALQGRAAELEAKVTSSGSSSGALWLNGMKLLSYSSVTSGTTVTGGTARLEDGKLVITVRQAANTADGFSTSPGAVFALPGTMATVENAEIYDYSDTSKEITLDAVSEVQYTFGEPQSQEQRQIQWTSTQPSDKLTFGKTGEDSSGHIEYDGDNYYILTAANATLDDKPLRSISDPLPADLLIPPAQIGQLFTLKEDEKGNALSNARLAANLTLTITAARIYRYKDPQNALGMVTLTDGMTRYKLTADKTDAYDTKFTDGQTVTIQKSTDASGSLSVKIGDAEALDVPIGDLETHLQTHGFAVTAKTQYTVAWDFGMDYKIASGDAYTLRIPVAAKSSFQQLVDDQVVYRGAASASSSPSNYGKKQFKVTNTAEFTEATTTTPTSKSVSGYYNGDCAISKDSQEKEATTGDVLHYSVTVHQDSHLRGEDGVPVVDVMSGAQCLLAPAKANQGQSWAAGMTPITKGGTSYYKLTLPEEAQESGRYTYKGVWLGGYYADSVTVIRYDKLTEAEEQKYDHTGGSTSVGNAIAQDGYVTEIRWYLKSSTSWIDSSRTISYQALADTSLSVEGAPDAGTLKNIAYLNDRDGERLFYTTGVIPVRSVSGAKELLDADGNVLSGDTSIIGAGETVHYRLSVYNPTESQVLIPEEQIYDVLPDTKKVFTWTADQNVKVKGYAYETSTETPAFEWAVTEGQLRWPQGVTVPAGDTLYIYVDLTFPQDAETDSTWDQYCTAAGSDTINNIFHLVNDTRTISHTLALPARAYLQKGVQQMRYQYSNKSAGYKDISDLRFYPERSTGNFNYTTIIYYALVYNDGEGPLYLTELQDRIESDAEKSVVHITSTSSPITPITSKLNLSGLPESAQLVEAAITTTKKTDEKGDLWVYTFAPSDKYSNMETLSYDAVAKAYYLQPGQVLAFTYQARVNGASDIAVNTLTMPAYDPHHAGVSVAENIQIKNNVSIKGKTLNDGSCDLWTEYEATQQQGFASDRHADSWLYSTVTLRKGNAVPGIQKEALQKRTISGDVSPCNGYAGPGDAVQWQVTVSSEGKNILKGYTITDTFPERYTLAAGDVQVTGNLGSPTDSYTLFTVQGYMMDSTGAKVQSIETNIDTYTVGASEAVAREYSYYKIYRVKFYYNENDQLVMQLTVLDGEYGTVYPGMTSKLTYWTANYTSTLNYTTYLNTAVLTLPDQEIDYDDVTMGRILRDEDGNPTGIQARATVNVAGAYSTASSKTVTEEEDESNTTNSLVGGAIALTQKDSGHNGYTGFTYTLEVNNDLSGSAGTTTGIQWMTIIDNLPQIGDKLTLNQKEDRYSEFKVDFQTDPNVRVWYKTAAGTEIDLGASQYTVQYSTKTSFTDEDWNGTQSADWNEASTDARSIRVALRGTEDAPVIPAGATVYVSFDCQVAADQPVEPGAIAWNSFGYRYQMSDDNLQLEASPLEVGVMIPDYPRIRKSLVTEELTEQQAVEDVTFRFLVYSGKAPTGTFNSGRDLMDALVGEGRTFSLAEVKLTKDSSTNTLKLQNLMQYSYDKDGDRTLTPTNNPWVWANDETYTIVELGDDPHAWLGAYWDYDFYTLNDSEVNSYTFTYNKATSQLADVVNRYTERELHLLKVDEKDADTKLAGAIFGLYSENQEDQLTDERLTVEATKHGLTDAQIAELQGNPTVTVSEGAGAKTYYLCRLGKSSDYGQIFWDDLNRENYCYQELWAPDGYLITQDTPTTITFDENGNYIRVINQTITNKKFYNLPKTGGMGRWQLPLLGFGLCGAVVLVLGNKRRKKGKSFPS